MIVKLFEDFKYDLLLESKTPEEIKQLYFADVPDRFFNEFVKADPTSRLQGDKIVKIGKYVKWIVSLWKQSKTKAKLEDMYKFTNTLKKFEKLKNSNVLKTQGVETDIIKYKSLPDLETTLEPFKDETSHREEVKIQKSKDAEKVFENDKCYIVIPKTHEASCNIYGRGTSWCTAVQGNDYFFKNYSAKGPLFIIINKKDNDEKYQFHIPSKQFKDIRDRQLDCEGINEVCEEFSVSDFILNLAQNGGYESENDNEMDSWVSLDSRAYGVEFYYNVAQERIKLEWKNGWEDFSGFDSVCRDCISIGSITDFSIGDNWTSFDYDDVKNDLDYIKPSEEVLAMSKKVLAKIEKNIIEGGYEDDLKEMYSDNDFEGISSISDMEDVKDYLDLLETEYDSSVYGIDDFKMFLGNVIDDCRKGAYEGNAWKAMTDAIDDVFGGVVDNHVVETRTKTVTNSETGEQEEKEYNVFVWIDDVPLPKEFAYLKESGGTLCEIFNEGDQEYVLEDELLDILYPDGIEITEPYYGFDMDYKSEDFNEAFTERVSWDDEIFDD